jgi:hypothetical protein
MEYLAAGVIRQSSAVFDNGTADGNQDD